MKVKLDCPICETHNLSYADGTKQCQHCGYCTTESYKNLTTESQEYVEIEVENNRKIKLDKDAQILVARGDEQLVVYADELMSGDNIIMDNRDYLWTINNSDNDATL